VDPINSAGVITACYSGNASAWLADACLKKPANRDHFTDMFSMLVRQRLSLFRVSALPAGRNSYPEDNAVALRAARLDSANEQELLLVQTKLTDRSENLRLLYDMDPRLNYLETRKYRDVSELVPVGTAAPIEIAG
jgi:hypothetical protein